MFDFVAFKKFIEDNGYKQKFIAQKADVSEAMFSAILSGKAKCSLETYVNICKTLEVPLGTFLRNPDIAA